MHPILTRRLDLLILNPLTEVNEAINALTEVNEANKALIKVNEVNKASIKVNTDSIDKEHMKLKKY